VSTRAEGSVGGFDEPALTKADYAYREMRSAILDGRLRPGAVVTSEVVAAELRLSTTPIREATRRLVGEQLVTLSAHRDVRVNPLSSAEITELYAVRFLLDPFAAALAATHTDDAGLTVPREVLPKKLRRMEPHESVHTNRAFHSAIYRRSGNDVLTALLDSLWDRTDRYRLILAQPPQIARQAHDEHIAIAEAFEARDAERIRVLTEEHMHSTLSNLLQHLERWQAQA